MAGALIQFISCGIDCFVISTNFSAIVFSKTDKISGSVSFLYISLIFKKLLLGRWTIDYCQKKINKKIDLSNEDHCGACNNIRTVDMRLYSDNFKLILQSMKMKPYYRNYADLFV